MDWHITDDIPDSPSGEEPNGEGNLLGSGPLKKGPWTSSEDAILADYVRKHGEGNWNAVQKFSGLSRCGKSCRLRWANHLRPDLKKGAFSPEEERHIVELHAKLGNKWARMAAELPGRTDNEIKNFWNTRIKKQQRAGLPIYPPDVCLKKVNDSQQSPDSGTCTFSNDLPICHHFVEASNFVIPEFKIERPLNPDLYSYPSLFLDRPTSNILPQGLGPSCSLSYMSPTIHLQKRLQESNNTPHGLRDTASSSFFRQSNTNDWEKQHHPNQLPPLSDSYPCTDPSLYFPLGSHALVNGNPSTSEPNFGSAKSELPSLQSSESDSILWDASASFFPSFECTDPLAQFPQAGPNQLQSTPDTDGLLESVVCPPKRLKTSKLEFSEKTDPEYKTTGEPDDLSIDLLDTEWGVCVGPITPMGPSVANIFSDFNPLTGYSADELQSTDVILGPEAETLYADPEQHLTCSNLKGNIDSYQLDPLRPDTWFNTNLLSPESEQGTNYQRLQKALSAIGGDDTQQRHL